MFVKSHAGSLHFNQQTPGKQSSSVILNGQGQKGSIKLFNKTIDCGQTYIIYI